MSSSSADGEYDSSLGLVSVARNTSDVEDDKEDDKEDSDLDRDDEENEVDHLL